MTASTRLGPAHQLEPQTGGMAGSERLKNAHAAVAGQAGNPVYAY